MRIATWNIERLKHISRQKEIEQICSDVGADILVLTEADNRVRIGSLSYYESEALPERCEVAPGKIIEYKSTERRVVIYSRHGRVEATTDLSFRDFPYREKSKNKNFLRVVK